MMKIALGVLAAAAVLTPGGTSTTATPATIGNVGVRRQRHCWSRFTTTLPRGDYRD
jgi:hypothetical protein